MDEPAGIIPVEALQIGEIIVRNGVEMRHIGRGLLEPVRPVLKRFDAEEARPLGS